MSDTEDFNLGDVFTEPPRPPTPPPTISKYTRDEKHVNPKDGSAWTEIAIRLVGSHPLWGHHLWNAALALASYLDDNRGIYQDKCVLELGAGGALPSIVTWKNGGRKAVITDYPDNDLVENMRFNVAQNAADEDMDKVDVKGYIWGTKTQSLVEALPAPFRGYQLIILSDLIFNHSQHVALLKTCEEMLAPAPSSTTSTDAESTPSATLPTSNIDTTTSNSTSTPTTDTTSESQTPEEFIIAPSDPNQPCVLVFYTHHRPHLAHRDMQFFDVARERGWKCEEIVKRRYDPMFPEDSGAVSVRSTVHGWRLTR